MTKLSKTITALGLVWALGAGASFAATTVEVGRVKLALNEDSWVVSDEMPYNKEVSSASGTIQGKARVLTLSDANAQVQAVMYVGATYGRSQVYTRGSKCGENPGLYVRDFNGAKPENFRCVFVGGPFDTAALQKGAAQDLQKASQTAGAAAISSPTAYFVIVHMTANGGVIIRAEGLFAPGFMGLPDGKPVAEMPAGLSPAVAAWADKLAESALDALTSFRGGLPVPKVEFAAQQK